jgi:hypothetical protein
MMQAGKIPPCELRRFPGGHFDLPWHGKKFPTVSPTIHVVRAQMQERMIVIRTRLRRAN